MSNTVMIPRASLRLATDGTNSSENACSHLSLDRHVGASLSLAETRRQYVVDIAVTVAHIRELLLLEDEAAL